jgi:hypothetical protein
VLKTKKRREPDSILLYRDSPLVLTKVAILDVNFLVDTSSATNRKARRPLTGCLYGSMYRWNLALHMGRMVHDSHLQAISMRDLQLIGKKTRGPQYSYVRKYQKKV